MSKKRDPMTKEELDEALELLVKTKAVVPFWDKVEGVIRYATHENYKPEMGKIMSLEDCRRIEGWK